MKTVIFWLVFVLAVFCANPAFAQEVDEPPTMEPGPAVSAPAEEPEPAPPPPPPPPPPPVDELPPVPPAPEVVPPTPAPEVILDEPADVLPLTGMDKESVTIIAFGLVTTGVWMYRRSGRR